MELNLASMFEVAADAVPERQALACGQQRLTYAELRGAVNRLAGWLQEHGIGRGDHIGLYLYNGIECVEWMLAAYAIRAVPVGINFRYRKDELGYVCRDAGVAAVVYHQGLGGSVADVASELGHVHHWVEVSDATGELRRPASVVTHEAVVREAPRGWAPPPRSGDDHYLLYTGGTTGRPKGVVWRHEDIILAALSTAVSGVTPTSSESEIAAIARASNKVALPVAPLSHASGQWPTLSTLMSGGRLVLYPERHFHADRVWRLIESEEVTAVTFIGDSMARPMADALEAGGYRPDSLRVIGSGGSLLSAETKHRLLRRLPSVTVVDAFGSSEAGAVGATVSTADVVAEAELGFSTHDETAVVDDELNLVPPGDPRVGRVARRGHIPLRYHNDPEKTASTFVTVDGRRWALTGDMARVEGDGRIILVGRASLCINTGGEKVYPEEVEAIVRAHADVVDALVAGVPDARWGEQVGAVVQRRPRSRLTASQLAQHCRQALAAYKAPRRVAFVDAIPRSAAGKPDYAWARSVLQSRGLPTDSTSSVVLPAGS